MRASSVDSEAERAAPSAPGTDVVGSARRCPVCGQPMTGRKTSACSDRCRAAKSRQRRGDNLALVEEQLMRALSRVRTLRGTPARTSEGGV
jgi:predicted nucleic acid-binding Zn ribbon protein